jgi:diadenosine tetraphosphate (Ap4A) HIT family hydrolase
MITTVSPHWELHPRLANDTVAVGDLALSRVLVSLDANYPWLVLVPRQPGAIEIIDLDEAGQSQLFGEISRLARVLKALTRCDKLNIAAIGNVVPQLHVHVVARRRTDAAWPKPVWGAVPALAYEPGELDRFVTAVRHELGL